MSSIELDATDRRILRALQANGRISNLDLAQAVHLSPAQANRRHRRLEQLGLVQGYETRLNAQRLGLLVHAFVHVTMAPAHTQLLQQFRQRIGELDAVLECHAVSGDFDYVLKVVATDLKALSDLIMTAIMTLPGVQSVRSTVCLDEIKCRLALPL